MYCFWSQEPGGSGWRFVRKQIQTLLRLRVVSVAVVGHDSWISPVSLVQRISMRSEYPVSLATESCVLFNRQIGGE
jgi:hypothetical protein